MIFHLPPEFEQEILPFLDESQPTPKETVVVRLLENSWHKANIKAIMNFLFSIPCDLFFKSEDGKISFS